MNREKNIFLFLYCIILCIQLHAASGRLFTISQTNNTLTIRTTVTNHSYSSAGVKILTPNYSITNANNTCNSIYNGYCVFSVSDINPKTISITGGDGNVSLTLCLNAIGQISCQNYNVSIGGSTPPNNYTYAYPTSTVATLPFYMCPVNSLTGLFGTCSTLTQGLAGGLAINSIIQNNNYLYYSVQDSGGPGLGSGNVKYCPLNSDGTVTPGAGCTASAFSGAVPVAVVNGGPRTLVFNTSIATAYLAINPSNQGTILVCDVLNNQLVSNSCVLETFSSNYALYGLALNPTQPFLYAALRENGGGAPSIQKCDAVNSSTPLNCVDSGATGFLDPVSVTSSSTYVYISEQNDVHVCPILNSGSLGPCINANPPTSIGGVNTSSPTVTVLNPDETAAYIVFNGSAVVGLCPINASNGTYDTANCKLATLSSINTGIVALTFK